MTNLEIIKDILNENLNIDPQLVNLDSSIESLGLDSLDLVELVCELEDRCEIDFGEPTNLEFISDLIEHIQSLQA